MANKVKIEDQNGVQVFPITHVSAVLDNSGNSVEQVLAAQTDLINQKQLEVGAVPSDLTPTKGSSHWVTSDGVYQAVNEIHTIKSTPTNYIYAITDSEGRVLAGITDDLCVQWFIDIADGLKLLTKNNNSSALVIADELDRILLKLRTDGTWQVPILKANSLDLAGGGVLGSNLKNAINNSLELLSIRFRVTGQKTFEIYVPNIATGENIIHSFKHCSYTKDCSAQGGSANLVCGDMLDPVAVMNENRQSICQPNMNAIYMISATNEEKHVGMGGEQGGSHGCEVRDYTYIFIDGKSYTLEDVFNITGEVKCSTFEIIQKSHTYKVDAARSSSNTENTPAIENGEPVVSTEHFIHIRYELDNHITWRNKITIKRDNIQFSQLNMGMLAGFYPYFSECIINDDKNSHVHFEKVNGSMVVTPIGDSNAVVNQWLPCAESTMFGGVYEITQRMFCDDALRQKDSFLMSVTQDSDSRFKSYFNPVRTVNVSNPETFNIGDVISVTNERKINISINN